MTRPLLIAGAGIAGLWAALKAAPHPVILVTGSPLGLGSSTGWAQGGIAAALAEDDSPDLHAADTISAGAGLVDEDAAHLLATAGPKEIEDLYALGAPFEKEADGRWALSREAAHSRARVARVKGDQAGAGILSALIKAVQIADHITIREGWRVIALLPDTHGECAGALIENADSVREAISASSVILATGSLCGLYEVTTVPASSQGQALAMAARLGANIQDAEFVQFHPTAIRTGENPAPLATEALRGEGAILIDENGQRFMSSVHPDAELAPRDIVARAVHRQIQSGHDAFLDARDAVGQAFPDRFPAVFSACMRAGIDPRHAPIPVAPAAHYHMGGIQTNLDGFTGIPGLYAIGECASTGVHGANRLASNSLLDGLVFGHRAAIHARHNARNREKGREIPVVIPDIQPPALTRLRQVMSSHVGVERNRAGLNRALDVIDQLTQRFGPASALLAARFVVEAALARSESRGGHYRTDYPDTHGRGIHSSLTLSDLAPCDHIYAAAGPAE